MHIESLVKSQIISSLEKVFADDKLEFPTLHADAMLKNEVYSFQLAYCSTEKFRNVKVRVNSALKPLISVYQVGLIPVELPLNHLRDLNVLRTAPGLYPDLLEPVEEEGIVILPGQSRSLWFSLGGDAMLEPGKYEIEISLASEEGEELTRSQLELEVLDAALPPQKIIHTEWLHADCLATWYDVEVFSEEHWHRLEQYIACAVQHGANMILTPLFTPPLDTQIGGERPTVQLVGVTKRQDQYSFDFSRLVRWIDLCEQQGMQYFEFSHLFTQWGANHAPKIVATENGEIKRIFGWKTDAQSPEYQNFLDQFLPRLVEFVRERKLEKRVFFHTSDEPYLNTLESYRSASTIMHRHLADFPIMDALSDFEFYQSGLVQTAIPATDAIEPFLENGVPNLWTYYCSAQDVDVSNRFICQPSARTRILGLQLYKYQIKGFLHWGFNFYYSQQSKFPIDPFRVTDGDYWVPAGDTFVVYPGASGPLPSLRLKILAEAFQDIRALSLLEEYIGRDAVLALVEEGLDQPLTFKEYPRETSWFLEKRKLVYGKLRELAGK